MSEENKKIVQVLDKLRDVKDPEIPVNIVDLGLIYNLDLEENSLEIEMTLTSMGCPTAGAIKQEVERQAKKVDNIQNVNVELVYDPPWSLEDHATEEGKAKIRSMGISIPEY